MHEALRFSLGKNATTYTIMNRGKRVGWLHFIADNVPPIWTWQITVNEKTVASGAAFTFASAKDATRFAWRGVRGSMPITDGTGAGAATPKGDT